LLPPSLWTNKNAAFLDPCSKTGVFLREIAKRLLKGLEKEIPDLHDRINHIFKNQLYAIDRPPDSPFRVLLKTRNG
jgi:site-specific DNA-methyltransferase (adenine-specific)